MFWPVADGCVLPDDDYIAYQERRFNDTPLLIGTNSDEGAMFARGGTTTSDTGGAKILLRTAYYGIMWIGASVPISRLYLVKEDRLIYSPRHWRQSSDPQD